MLLAAAIAFALGVLSVVLAGEWERRKKARAYPTSSAASNVVGYGSWNSAGYIECSNNLTRTFGTWMPDCPLTIPQDSTIPSESK